MRQLGGGLVGEVIDVIDGGAPDALYLNLGCLFLKGLLHSLLNVELFLANLLLVDKGILDISPDQLGKENFRFLSGYQEVASYAF